MAVAAFQKEVKWLRTRNWKDQKGFHSRVKNAQYYTLHTHTHLRSLHLLTYIFSLQTWLPTTDTLAPLPDKEEVFVPGT